MNTERIVTVSIPLPDVIGLLKGGGINLPEQPHGLGFAQREEGLLVSWIVTETAAKPSDVSQENSDTHEAASDV